MSVLSSFFRNIHDAAPDRGVLAAVRAAMSTGDDAAAAAVDDAPTTPRAQSFTAEDVDRARAEGRRAGAEDERHRVAEILGDDEANDRRELALELALASDMTPAQARKILAAAARELAPKGLLAEMASIRQPRLGMDAPFRHEELSDFQKGKLEAERVLALP